MNKLLLYTCAGLMMGVTSCKKFLEQSPDNRTDLDSPEKVSQLLGTAYPQANYMAFFESISDNVADKGAGTIENFNVNPFFFQDVSDNQQDSPEFYWNACYTAIATANLALQACDEAPDTSLYRAQRGEALLARAYAHFMLVNVFAETYDPATAADNPGIPYVTEPEKVVFKQYDRKTVEYVYDMIEKDITEGLPLLDDNTYTIPRYHFTRQAAHAFAARFYLFKQEYDKVIEHANAVFGSGSITGYLRPWNTTYRTMTYNELWAVYAKATEPANILLVETSSVWARYYYNLRYGLTSTKRDEILGDNVTGGTWAFRYQLYTAGTNNYLLPKINEYFVKASVNATIGYPYVMVPLFTMEEVLFNRAEAYTYLNNTTAALSDLNTYASTRIINYSSGSNTITTSSARSFYNTSNTQLALVATILDFKRAEYVQEGMRWFDILRYHIPVTHTNFDGSSLTLTSDDKRRLFQLPDAVSLSGLEQNPR